ncbi:MAG TPA: glycoside hydrolase family 99-like domain-containing protein [Accumulibacter sp.]|uniref:glycoside hydrolase family 99-like domain-containing protein n=1 Tax=Accumulibacter sp. TaxID=2053492 RepID=UPI002B6FE093|nr:glycoside hydrolase family 99-like domain-containing protein [Accumulibacter sp.]HMW54786.1 glycoside hydrolase family 99-like domain-containing protein [Accumulibacter sp.]HNG77952.1 glycoside hydrolase family 99-like domain-containing protein [Burkholderiaceae bacterium]
MSLARLLVVLSSLALANAVAQAKDLLVIGNSLTQHSPAPALGWQGNWGMAASTADKDFVHQLGAKLQQATTEKLQVSTIPGYSLERSFLSEQPPSMPLPKPGSYDYIVVEIGDNIDFSGLHTDLFDARYDSLLAGLRGALRPSGRLVCLGKWWANDMIDAEIRRACERRGGVFLPLGPISALPGAHASSERTFINKGVGEHPGDRGMAEIADQVFCALSRCSTSGAPGNRPDIGVFYFPGWHSQSRYWRDIKGLPDSRSPGRPWPDREPLLGYYAEEDPKVAEQHIDWASRYGITFFAYDWYWEGKGPYLNHAIDNFRRAPNNSKLKFSLLWANHSGIPRSLAEFDLMVDYWLRNYLNHPQYYRVSGKPVVFIYSNAQLDIDAHKFGSSAVELLARADKTVREQGLPGLFLIATTNARPDDSTEKYFAGQGYSAYSGWNYVAARDKSASVDYNSMVETYLDFYSAAANTTGSLNYIVPASPGWDSRPWQGSQALVRSDPTPAKFRAMLNGACQLLASRKSSIMNIVMIEAWNEFGEGAYIEPSKQWNFSYLETVESILTRSCPVEKRSASSAR